MNLTENVLCEWKMAFWFSENTIPGISDKKRPLKLNVDPKFVKLYS